MSAAAALVLTDRLDGPWLGIRHGASAEASAIVLAGDPRAPRAWRRIDAGQPMETGSLDSVGVTPLSAFGVSVTLYAKTRVLSVWRHGRSFARQYGHPAGGVWEWAGQKVDRIRIERGIIDLVAIAAKQCNSEARGIG